VWLPRTGGVGSTSAQLIGQRWLSAWMLAIFVAT
jgi:hypothetical protein